MSIHIDRFSAGLDDLKRQEQADPAKVLAVLDRTKRFSVFESSENMTIATTMTNLFERGHIKNVGGAFPWTKIEVTESGRALMGAALAQPEGQSTRTE